VKSQLVPLQVVALAPTGFEHEAHEVVPHESTLVFDAHTPLQSCVPFGHTPEQAADAATQAPAHGFIPEGQAGTHAVPLHVTVPPVGAWQGVHDEVPQLPVAVLLTQTPPQLWYPSLHAIAHAPPMHWAAP